MSEASNEKETSISNVSSFGGVFLLSFLVVLTGSSLKILAIIYAS